MSERYRCGPVTMIPRGGRWHFQFQLNKQRRTKTTREPLRNNAKAERIALDFHEKELLRSRGEEPEPTLREAFLMWVSHPDHVLNKSRSHLENMERCGRLHLGALADLPLTQLDGRRIQDERGEFRKTHGKSSANQWLTYIRIVCRWAITRKMIRSMPFSVGELKVSKRVKPMIPIERAAEWLEEVDALTAHDPGVGMVLRLMLGLGLRFDEASQARWEWLDLERAVYTPGDTKGGEAWPRPVPEWILADLGVGAPPFGWMCPTLAGRLVTPGRVRRTFEAACKAVDLPRMTPHRIRATYATWLSVKGVPIQDIQVALGHKDIRTTAIYLGVDLGRIARAQASLAAEGGLAGRKSGTEGA